MRDSEVERLCRVLEGWCPKCGEKLEVESIGGFPEWLHGPNTRSPFVTCPFSLEGVEVNEWERPSAIWDGADRVADSYRSSNLGAVGFTCECGETYWCEATASGDWVGP